MVKAKFLQAQTESHYALFKDLLQEYAKRDLADPVNSTIWDDIAQLPGRYAPPLGGVLLVCAPENPPLIARHQQQPKVGDNTTSESDMNGAGLAGCGAFVSTRENGVAELKRVYVRSSFRRQGLARALTLALIDQARAAGYQTAAISTWPHNSEALALYRQLNFVPLAPFKEHKHSELVFLGFAL